MNIQQLPSGSYRIRVMVNGTNYSKTFKKYPTKDEIINAFKELSKEKITKQDVKELISVKDYAYEYLRIKENVLSPSTRKGYFTLARSLSTEFAGMRLDQVDNASVQKEINIYSASHKPKTVRNYYGFILAILKTFRPSLTIYTSVPKQSRYEPYIPIESDVYTILDYIKRQAPQYFLPLSLACHGLRRSEILAATSDMLNDDDVLHISKAMVQNENFGWEIKGTKTKAGTRSVKLNHETAELLRKQKYAYTGHPDNINKYLVLAEEKLGIPHFTLHKLRHFYVTMAHYIGIPDVYIAETVGHSDISTTRRIYTHAQEPKTLEMQEHALNYLTEQIFTEHNVNSCQNSFCNNSVSKSKLP